ncbi:hypothetical protein CEP54_010597 [Fusarium duplospermum]|uniref:Uncharacterized protein n=1 Tax=Fusarium duplospermum TaxID=1325734 RepID=A0A428PJ74_9HYPO|nr:hypothetical protein CEP54_010597 [Fusarium duplospermum]
MALITITPASLRMREPQSAGLYHCLERATFPEILYPKANLCWHRPEELLLATLVESGYLPEYGPGLVQLMSQNSNGMMTLSVDKVDKKNEFINVIEKDPYQAAEQILGPVYDRAYFQCMSIYTGETVGLVDYGVFGISVYCRSFIKFTMLVYSTDY